MSSFKIHRYNRTWIRVTQNPPTHSWVNIEENGFVQINVDVPSHWTFAHDAQNYTDLTLETDPEAIDEAIAEAHAAIKIAADLWGYVHQAPAPSNQKTCTVCGKPFDAKRPDATMCGNTCRVRAKRQREKLPASTPAPENPWHNTNAYRAIQRQLESEAAAKMYLPAHYTIIRWEWLQIELSQDIHGIYTAVAYVKEASGFTPLSAQDNDCQTAINSMMVLLVPKLVQVTIDSYQMSLRQDNIDQHVKLKINLIESETKAWLQVFNPTKIQL